MNIPVAEEDSCQVIRPLTNPDTARHLVERLYGLKVKSVKELDSWNDKNYRVTVMDEYENSHISHTEKNGYVLKILNSEDSKKKHVDAELEILKILYENGIFCPQPIRNVYGDEKSYEKICSSGCSDGALQNGENERKTYGFHVVRLLTFIPGEILYYIPYSSDLMFRMGKYIGRINRILKHFHHDGLHDNDKEWSMENVPAVTQYLYLVENEADKTLVTEVVEAFNKEVLSNLHKFQKGPIHGDFNDHNLLLTERMDSDGEHKQFDIAAVIDFGDGCHSYYLFEIAITMCYANSELLCMDQIEVGGHILAGYLTEMGLNEAEMDALSVCVAARYCQYVTLNAHEYTQHENEYLMRTIENSWQQLRQLQAIDKQTLYSGWNKIIQSYE